MKRLMIAATALALTAPAAIAPAHAAPRGEWFLVFDMWFCSTKSCEKDGPPHDDFVERETFATKKQCLAEGRHQVKLVRNSFAEEDCPYLTKSLKKVLEVYAYGADIGMTVAEISPRCERHRSTD